MTDMRPTQPDPPGSAERILHILLNEVPVGTISHFQGDQNVFAFDESYVLRPTRPTLSLSFKSPTGHLLTRVHTRRTRLHPFFSNLLPEGHLRAYLAARAGVDPEREFFLLSALRDDLPGAVRIRSDRPIEDVPQKPSEEQDKQPDSPLRFSLSGVQLKFSAIREAKGGLTIPVSGAGGDWILKLPSSTFTAVPEAEYSMMTIAKAMGIDVPEVMLVDTEEIEGLPADLPPSFGPGLAIKRYDRGPQGERIHAEDFAQIFGLYPAQKYGKASYENIAFVVWTETGEAGLKQFVRRLVFTVITGNADMHVKNWSLIYPDGITPELSPAYDLVPTILFMPQDTNLGLSLGKTKNMHAVNSDVLRRFAANARLPESLVLQIARESIDSFVEVWAALKAELPLAPRQIEAIEKHMAVVPITREMASHFPTTTPTADAVSQQDLPGNWFISGDVELDEAVEPGMIVYRANNGETLKVPAPQKMLPWILGEQAASLARRHPRLANTEIVALVGSQLFDEWRYENFVRFDRRNLETPLSQRDLEKPDIFIPAKFFPTDWRKLQKAFHDGNTNIFDIVFPDGELWTWTGKVLDLQEKEGPADGRKRAVVKISVTDPKFLMRLARTLP